MEEIVCKHYHVVKALFTVASVDAVIVNVIVVQI